MLTIHKAIRQHGARRVYHACDAEAGCPDRMVELGLPRPSNLGDVFRAMSAAYAAMSLSEQAEEDRRDEIRGRYVASASKSGVGPILPRNLPISPKRLV